MKDLKELEADYAKACVAYCECMGDRASSEAAHKVQAARSAILSARAAQQEVEEEVEEEREAGKAMESVNLLGCLLRIGSQTMAMDGGRLDSNACRKLLSSLKAAGWHLTRSPPTPASTTQEQSKWQGEAQEPVRLGLGGVWRCPCCKARPDFIERVP